MKSVITNCGGKNMILQNLMQDGGNNGKGRPTSTEFIKKIIDLNMLHPPLFLHIVCNLPLLSHPLPKLMLGRPTSTEFIKKIIDLNMLRSIIFLI